MAESRFEFHFEKEPWICTGSVRVTDPFYTRADAATLGPNGIPIAGVVAAKAGPWQTCVIADRAHGVDTCLIAWEKGMAGLELGDSHQPPSNWKLAGFRAAVDSGQCCIFDDAHYPETPDSVLADGQRFDDKVEAVTEDGRFGLVAWGKPRTPKGVVTFSGFGDGLYEVFVHRAADGLVDAVRVQFLSEDEVSVESGETDANAANDAMETSEDLSLGELDESVTLPNLELQLEVDDA